MKKILVVVDMQNDFIDGPLGTPEARAVVDNVCAKIREGEWDEIIVTKDTHYDSTYFDTQEGQKLQVKHCIENTDGWELNSRVFDALDSKFLTGNCHIEVFFKNTFGSIHLVEYLKNYVRDVAFSGNKMYTVEDIVNGVTSLGYGIELTLIGVCTDICVISNALLLKAHYPEMKIVVDAACCAGTTPAKHRMALAVMKSCQVDVVNMPEDWTILYSTPYVGEIRDDSIICANGLGVKED